MERPNLDGVDKSVIAYIVWLEDGRSGASDLIIELNLTAKVFAEDLRKIREDDTDTKYVGKSDKSKKFEHAMTLFDKIEKIRTLASYFKGVEQEAKRSGTAVEERIKKYKNGSTANA